MHSLSVSLVLGLTSPTLWVCALMRYVLGIHCLGKSMCGWCFNINLTELSTTFCHAWYVKTSVTWLQQHTSLLIWLKYFHLSFLLAQIRMCLHTQVCVNTKCQLLFLGAACPITHITHECHFTSNKDILPTLGCMLVYTMWGHNLYICFLPGLCLFSLSGTCRCSWIIWQCISVRGMCGFWPFRCRFAKLDPCKTFLHGTMNIFHLLLAYWDIDTVAWKPLCVPLSAGRFTDRKQNTGNLAGVVQSGNNLLNS